MLNKAIPKSILLRQWRYKSLQNLSNKGKVEKHDRMLQSNNLFVYNKGFVRIYTTTYTWFYYVSKTMMSLILLYTLGRANFLLLMYFRWWLVSFCVWKKVFYMLIIGISANFQREKHGQRDWNAQRTHSLIFFVRWNVNCTVYQRLNHD